MTAYYNDNNPFCVEWLFSLTHNGLIAPGAIDSRSIVDVGAKLLRGYQQCHFFAGIGGWSYALRLAGWPDYAPVWTGSCPCQPFSTANPDRAEFDDERHLWPYWRDLIDECRPPTIFGEQVARASSWIAMVRRDLEKMGYAVGCIPFEAASCGANHLRDRYFFVADASGKGLSLPQQEALQTARRGYQRRATPQRDWWSAESGIRRVAHGVPGRVGGCKAYGNAIVPAQAAEFIGAFLDG